MFVLDDLAKAPFKGFLFLAREVANAVNMEQENQKLSLMSQLTDLHKRLESGEIDPDEFDDLEAELLDQLEQFDN